MIGLPLVIASFAAISEAHFADLSVPPLTPAVDFAGWYLRGCAYDDPPLSSALPMSAISGNWPSANRGRMI
jgi:hypothetical protein